MYKKLLIPKEENQIAKFKDNIDGLIFPLKGYHTNFSFAYSLEEIEKILTSYPEKKKYLWIAKNLTNEEVDFLETQIKKINKQSFDGIFFYDLAIMKLKDRLQSPLIWAQEHMTTNYATINYWKKEGVSSVYLSSELKKEEIIEIRQKTKSVLFAQVFGYVPIFTSKRPLIQNYLKTFHLSSDAKEYYLKKEGEYYPIFDQKEGSFVLSKKVVDLRKQMKDRIDYGIYNAELLTEETLKQALNEEEITEIETDTGFFEREMIYKVKKEGNICKK